MYTEHVSSLFKNFPDKYPHNLEQTYSRVLNKLLQLWEDPSFDNYYQDLVMSSRIPPRRGFPHEIVKELLFIGQLHESTPKLSADIKHPKEVVNTWPDSTLSPQAFRTALLSNNLEQVLIYLNSNVSLDYRFAENEATPLLLAVKHDNSAVSSYLIQSGANVNACDKEQNTPLHWASFNGHTALVSQLMKYGATVDAQDENGRTPLVVAVVRNHVAVASLLLRNGANPQIASKESGSALEIAVRKNLTALVALLEGKAIPLQSHN